MSITVPVTEPASAAAGNTWQWRREDLADFPASSWTLTYYFRNSTDKFSIAATADGDAYAITVAKGATSNYRTGIYDWVAYVSSATERHEVARGRLQVLQNFALDAVFDGRTFARKMLDAIEAALLERATDDQLDLIDSAAGDRRIARTPAGQGLMDLRDKFRREVADEDRERRGVRSNRILAAG